MGIICCTSDEKGRNADGQLVDLPPVKWENIKDPYARFEASLPFNRIKLKTMIMKIDEAVKETQRAEKVGRVKFEDDEPPKYVTIQALRKALPTEAWRPLMEPDSRLS